MKLDPAADAAGFGLIALDEVDSTNAQALRYGRAGEFGPLWITATAQTAGRGRRGRVWVSEPGNLYASLLLADPALPARVAQISFVAALAVHDAICAAAPALAKRLLLKWPNDVLCNGRKVCGILVEAEGDAPMIVAAGIGVNCCHHPEDAMYPAGNLSAEGAAVTPEALFAALSRAMAGRLAQWNAGLGFADVRIDWLARGPAPGAGLRVRSVEGEVSGRFQTIDDEGNLVLTKPDGSRRRITAGDVFPANAPGGSSTSRTVPPGRRPA